MALTQEIKINTKSEQRRNMVSIEEQISAANRE